MSAGAEDGEKGGAPGRMAGGAPANPPPGASGADLALHYSLKDSNDAGEGEELRIAKPQFGDDDGTAGGVNQLRLNQSVVYSLLIRKRYPG